MKAIIGIEIHVQLQTASKMFCGCDAAYFAAEPNTHVCPVCLGLPGALPRANKKAMELAAKAGIALHCTVNTFSRFDRKNYMYPDLFKGYQITQYTQPICENGFLDVTRKDGSVFKVGIIRAHQEEDTAKSIHEKKWTLVDGNKAGIPLLEIVSAPDMYSIEDAMAFAQSLQTILAFIGVSGCDMEKGQMRFDVNVNLEIEPKVATPIAEIKNLNSFRSMGLALQYEIERQEVEFKETGIQFGKGNKTTRGWSDDRGETYLLRSKEEAEDYRYFPDPDLPPVVFTTEEIAGFASEVGMLPYDIYETYTTDLHMSAEIARVFSSDKALYEYFETCRKDYTDSVKLANWIKGELLSYINANSIGIKTNDDMIKLLKPANLIELLLLMDKNVLSGSAGKQVCKEMLVSGKRAEVIMKEMNLVQVNDTDVIEEAVNKVLVANMDAVAKYKAGKDGALMFLVGQVMRDTKGKGNPGMIKAMLEKKLSEK